MPGPTRSPILAAAQAAEEAWRTSAARKREVLDRARAVLTPMLPGVPVQSLTYEVEGPDELVTVTDGTVLLAVRADGTVWQARRGPDGTLTQGRRVEKLRDLAGSEG